MTQGYKNSNKKKKKLAVPYLICNFASNTLFKQWV